ncbi:MAG: peptidyl-prolyl cis-trans isomerase [Arenicella sp.]|nr:peptidyl-prolyl cis-trans isomerase [Arenicella sp.]
MRLKGSRYYLVLTLLLLGACTADKPDVSIKLDSDPANKVLATVGGEAITQGDVDFMLKRTFANAHQLPVDAQVQHNVLQSLVAAKAMKLSIQKDLSDKDLLTIRNKVKTYEEELYFKEYLIKNTTPEPASNQMVLDYYERHPEEFGAKQQRSFELLKTRRKPSTEKRDALISQISSIKTDRDWQQLAKDSELELVYQRGSALSGLLDKSLEDSLTKLDQGDSSEIIFIKGIPHILRLNNITELAPKPLSSVSADIRKKLAANQLKKAVKIASEKAVKLADVEFH